MYLVLAFMSLLIADPSSSSSNDALLNLLTLANRLQVHEQSLKQLYCSCPGFSWGPVRMYSVLTHQHLTGVVQQIAQRAAAATASAATSAASASNSNALGVNKPPQQQQQQPQQQNKKQKREEEIVGKTVGQTVGRAVKSLPSPRAPGIS
jgi:ribosomal protein L12E/L44/L45/RPP1/RPP2